MSEFALFTNTARAVLARAQFEAESRDHTAIAPEHLLAGLYKERVGIASKTLHNLKLPGYDLEMALDSSFEDLRQHGAQEIGLTDRSRQVLKWGVVLRRTLRHETYTTAHLLLGVCYEEQEIGTGILQVLGMDLRAVYDEVLRLIDERGLEERKSPRVIRRLTGWVTSSK